MPATAIGDARRADLLGRPGALGRGKTAERLFGRADKALYAAKEAGRDRIVTT